MLWRNGCVVEKVKSCEEEEMLQKKGSIVQKREHYGERGVL